MGACGSTCACVCVCAHCYDTYMYVENPLYLQAPAIVNFECKQAFSQRS